MQGTQNEKTKKAMFNIFKFMNSHCLCKTKINTYAWRKYKKIYWPFKIKVKTWKQKIIQPVTKMLEQLGRMMTLSSIYIFGCLHQIHHHLLCLKPHNIFIKYKCLTKSANISIKTELRKLLFYLFILNQPAGKLSLSFTAILFLFY